MDVLILCGGFAKRLEPISLFIPKHLLPIRGRPILDYILEDVSTLGAGNVVIATNRKFSDQFEYWVAHRKASGAADSLQLVIEPTINNDHKFGAIRGIDYAIKAARLNDDLLVIAGDNFYDFSLSEMVNYFNKVRKPTICAYDISSIEDAKRFGVLSTENGIVKKFLEKPENPDSTLISTGIYLFPRELLGEFAEYLKEGNNPDAPGYLIQHFIKNHEVHAVIPKGKWYDIGTLDSYNRVSSGK